MLLRRTPKYRHYKPKDLGMVVIDGHAHYLGKYDSPESRERYHRLVAEFHAGRPAKPREETPPAAESGLTVNELILAYARFVDAYYVKDGRPTVEPTNIRLVLRLVRRLYGTTPATSFGPLALKAVRDEMIRAGNCRSEINRRVGRVVRMFKWGVSEELVPPGVLEALRAVPGLRKGRSAAVREKPPVGPVLGRRRRGGPAARQPPGLGHDRTPAADRDAARRGRHHADRRPRHGGRRLGLRPVPAQDGAPRQVAGGLHRAEGPGGPAPWLDADREAYLFSPAEAMQERRAGVRAARKTRVQPSQADRSKARPKKTPGVRYTVASYRKAIQAACKRAGVARWHPHQLRHSAATEIRKRFGIEASRVILGHEDVRATQIYAEEDRDRGVEIMRTDRLNGALSSNGVGRS